MIFGINLPRTRNSSISPARVAFWYHNNHISIGRRSSGNGLVAVLVQPSLPPPLLDSADVSRPRGFLLST